LLRRLRLASIASLSVAAACTDNIGPTVGPCAVADGFPLTLAVGQYFAVFPTVDSACVRFGANASPDTVEYLVVPQIVTGTPGLTTGFRLLGNNPAAAAVTAQLVSPGGSRRASTARQFDEFLRRSEQTRRYGSEPVSVVASPRVAATPPAPAPPAPNRAFRVFSSLTSTQFTTVNAVLKVVKTHVAIYVDTLAPPGGLSDAALDSLGDLFDTRLYPIDTTAFGRESDVDGNGLVLVLMTPVVNRFVNQAQCDTAGYIAGFFFSFDVDPFYASNPNSNKAELFYSLVPDPAGTLSCAHADTTVNKVVPVTFIHEFQHMISFNEHALKRGAVTGEVLWLNEGMSHFAEELGGRSYLPDSAAYLRFAIGNLFNASQYLADPGSTILVTKSGLGTLEERGVEWLFVRYLVDMFGDSLTRKLNQTSLTGEANIEAQTGHQFELLSSRWALANWVSDLQVPGFTADSVLRYKSVQLRAQYASLHASRPAAFPAVFPLVPSTSAAQTVSLTGTLRAGSAIYHRAFQAPGAVPFALRFISQSGFPLPRAYAPRLNVIRIR